ncbi:hypothetical protein J0X14_18250 [Muricauda sp. CAU 1633]|uniref:hypothetical protein n=1 Tax=Allomuricauda sp. CAU 1633 TaxID=2816036 RepID=UPI001A8D9771|nr:hypothetical protein [Muricauda sp. CAU 1633]MBO0324258.1 hypothetical protein [Muricauda sp. CAU 1633]
MKAIPFILFLLLVTISCKTDSKKSVTQKTNPTVDAKKIQPDSLVQRWAIGRQLQNVESVIYDSDNDVYYASCGKSYKIGNEGFISKLSSTGNLLEQNWITNLNRPTGMAIHDGKLFVADINRLLVIEIATAKVVKNIPESSQNSGLNDVAINEKGDVFVTGSFVHSVFKVQGDSLLILAKDDEKLKWANGIASSGEDLIIGGMHLIKLNTTSAKMVQLITTPQVVDIDGLVLDGNGGLFATTVENSAIWHIDESGKAIKIASDSNYCGDLDLVAHKKRLVIARGNQAADTFFIESRPLLKY